MPAENVTPEPLTLGAADRVLAFLDNNAEQLGIDHEVLAWNAVDGRDAKLLRSDLMELVGLRAKLAAAQATIKAQGEALRLARQYMAMPAWCRTNIDPDHARGVADFQTAIDKVDAALASRPSDASNEGGQ